MTIIEQIKAEIERLKENILSKVHHYPIHRIELLDDLLAFLDTLESEKPMNQEELEEEINRLWERFADETEGQHNLFYIYVRFARHFAKWGAEHLADARKIIEVKPDDDVVINGHKLIYDKDKGYVTIVKSEESESPEIQNDLDGGGTKAVRLPDGRYVTEKLARELEEEIPNYLNELADYARRQAEELLIVVRKYEFLSEELSEELRTHFMSMFLEGTVWQKEQMMKDAVEAHIYQSANPVSEIGHPLHQAALLYEDKENAPYLKAGDRVKLIIVKED